MYTLDSREFIMFIDRELYELCVEKNTNTAALLIV